MKECEIVKEMLPLYIDGVCKEEVKASIERHLCECSECKALYEDMTAEMPLVNSEKLEPKNPFIKINKLHRRKTIILICIMVLAAMSLVGSLLYYFVFEKGVNVYCPKEPKAFFTTIFDSLKAETSEENIEIIVDQHNGAMLYGDNVNFCVAGTNTLMQFAIYGGFDKDSEISNMKIKPLLFKKRNSYGVSLKKINEILDYVVDNKKINLGEYSIHLFKDYGLDPYSYDICYDIESGRPISAEKIEELKQFQTNIDAYSLQIEKPLIEIENGVLNEFKKEIEVIKVLIIKPYD